MASCTSPRVCLLLRVVEPSARGPLERRPGPQAHLERVSGSETVQNTDEDQAAELLTIRAGFARLVGLYLVTM